MKKIITSVVLSLLMILTACSPASLSYLDQVAKTAKWKNYTQEGKMNMTFEMKDEKGKVTKFELPVSFSSVQDNMNAKANIKYDLKKIKAQAKNEADKIPVELPDEISLDFFVSPKGILVPKSEITGLLKDLTPEELKNVKESYVGLATELSSEDIDQKKIEEYVKTEEFKADMLKLINDGLDGFKAASEMKVNGNTYTYEADMNTAMKDLEGIFNTLSKNADKVAPTIVDMAHKMGYDKVTLEKVKEALKDVNANEIKEEVKKDENSIKDSKFKFETTFGEDKMEQKVSFDISMGKMGKMSMDANSISKKDDSAKVEIPTDAKYFTEKDLNKLFGAKTGPIFLVSLNDEFVEFNDQIPILKDNRTLVPFRAILEKAGAKVDWNQASKKVTATYNGKTIEMTIGNPVIKVDGKDIKLDVAPMVKNGRTLIPLRGAFENFGFKVEYEKDGDVHTIEIKK